MRRISVVLTAVVALAAQYAGLSDPHRPRRSCRHRLAG